MATPAAASIGRETSCDWSGRSSQSLNTNVSRTSAAGAVVTGTHATARAIAVPARTAADRPFRPGGAGRFRVAWPGVEG